jgi:DNA-directed RNA polymerase subunit RPC12/RpoP
MSQKSKPSWSPPDDFIRVESRVPGVAVFAPKPEVDTTRDVRNYTCPNCGASISYDVSAGGIACEYCGYTAPVHSQQVGRRAEEFEFTLETMSQAERGWGKKRQVLVCESCGGSLSLPQGALSTTCPYCASNQVNLTTTPVETLRPRFLVPFTIEPEKTRALARNWLGKGWFHPGELGANAVVRRFVGLYLPFWTFDARIQAHWRAQVGYEQRERHYNAREKRWETRTRIVWRWEEGAVPLVIDDHLITGSSPRRISHRILQRLYPFHLNALVAYQPDFLAGWRAQAYEITLTDAWEQGKRAMREEVKKACHQDIPSQHVRNFSMTADFADESWRYILLPVYLAAYKFEGRVFQVMVNGQTGAVAGQKPVAWWKVWLAIAALLAPGTLLGLIGLPLVLVGGAGIIPIGLGIILFIIGAVISFFLYRKARESEAR